MQKNPMNAETTIPGISKISMGFRRSTAH